MLLTGCGGGGGSSAVPSGVVVATPNPTADRPSSYTASYTGTLKQSVVNNLISSSPVTTATGSTVTANVSTSLDANGNPVFTSTESDVSPLSTLTTTTTTTMQYASANGQITVRAVSTSAKDSNGVTYQTNYQNAQGAYTNGVQTVLPEVAGSYTWNDASETYTETDPGINVTSSGQQPSIVKTIDGLGGYSLTRTELASTGSLANDTASADDAFNGTLVLPAIPGGRTFTFTAPSGGTISYVYANGATGSKTTTTVPSWIPTTLTKPSTETDTVTTGVALDPTCTPKLLYALANKVVQTFTTADAVYGTLETKTTTSYDVAGPGTVCAIVNDTLQTFYDYSAAQGPAPRLFPANSATVPAEVISYTETLSLQTTTASSTSRATQSVTPGTLVPSSLLLAKVQHLVHQQAMRSLTTVRTFGGTK